MSSYTTKDGTLVITKTVRDKAMNKRGISKIVHVIPEHPEFKSKAFANTLVAMFGNDLREAIESAKISK